MQPVDLQQVKIEVEVSKERKTATIEKATPATPMSGLEIVWM